MATTQLPSSERLARSSAWNRKKELMETIYSRRDEYGVKAMRDLADLLIAIFREDNDAADGIIVAKNQAKIELLKELKECIEIGRSRLL